jgi:hypothetical protein
MSKSKFKKRTFVHSLSRDELRSLETPPEERMKRLEDTKFKSLKDYMIQTAIAKGEIEPSEAKMMQSKGFKSSSLRVLPHNEFKQLNGISNFSEKFS